MGVAPYASNARYAPMSTSTHFPQVPNRPTDDPRELAERVLQRAVESVRALGFWVAILLPFLAVALLAVGALTAPLTLAALLLVEPAALVVGHDHTPEPADN